VEVSTEAGERDAVVKDDAHSDEGSSDLDLTPGSLKRRTIRPHVSARDGHRPLLTREAKSRSPSASSAGNSW